jgi:hypothetical protein
LQPLRDRVAWPGKPLVPGRLSVVGKRSDWLREERRKTLGDWVAFCLSCGHAQRYFEENAPDLTSSCPTCGGEMRSQCPECGARFSSVFTVECEECGGAVREAEAFGGPIRKPG